MNQLLTSQTNQPANQTKKLQIKNPTHFVYPDGKTKHLFMIPEFYQLYIATNLQKLEDKETH